MRECELLWSFSAKRGACVRQHGEPPDNYGYFTDKFGVGTSREGIPERRAIFILFAEARPDGSSPVSS